jgi:AcrR family transcriptional regulator
MRKRSSKQIFAETLLELSQHRTVDKITVQQLVEESGLSLQTFYNHFKDKADLILWVHKSKFEELLGKLGEDGYTFRDLLADNIRFYSEHKEFMWNALNHTHGQDSYGRISAQAGYTIMRRYVMEKNGLNSLPEDIDFYLKAYFCTSAQMYAEWAFNMKDTPLETFAGYIEEIIPEPLKKYLL